MHIFPAIDLYEGKAVRLYKGNYREMTVYNTDPLAVARDFVSKGACYIHMVDLEGAKDGSAPNKNTVLEVAQNTDLFVEVGGGIRSMDVIEHYLAGGVQRVILGTAAITDPDFLKEALRRFSHHIAVGADIKDGYVAIKGWTETSETDVDTFFASMQDLGVKTIICTDISKDGAMKGTNRELYRKLSQTWDIDIIASGGVSSMEDIQALKEMQLYGAIIGKAYYTGAIDLREAIEVTK